MADPRLLSTQAPQGPGRGGPLAESVSHLPDINQYGPDAELIAGPMQQWASAFEYENRRPPTPQEAERHKLLLISQGYSQMPDGSIRDVNAFNAKQRIDKATKLYNRLDEEYQDFEDSTFYKVGDAMSDAARVVLSPLIFLKKLGGEDTTNLLDPSARVRAGYSGSLSALQELAAKNHNMVQDYAKLRDAERLARVKGDAALTKTRRETAQIFKDPELDLLNEANVISGGDPNHIVWSDPSVITAANNTRQREVSADGKTTLPGADIRALVPPEVLATSPYIMDSGKDIQKTLTDAQGNQQGFYRASRVAGTVIDEIESDPQFVLDELALDVWAKDPTRAKIGFKRVYGEDAFDYMSAMTTILSSRLRDESGAAISMAERIEKFAEVVPTEADSPRTREMKRKLRESYIETFFRGGGDWTEEEQEDHRIWRNRFNVNQEPINSTEGSNTSSVGSIGDVINIDDAVLNSTELPVYE